MPAASGINRRPQGKAVAGDDLVPSGAALALAGAILAAAGYWQGLRSALGISPWSLASWWAVLACGSILNLPLPGHPAVLWNPAGTVLPAAFAMLILVRRSVNWPRALLVVVLGALDGAMLLVIATWHGIGGAGRWSDLLDCALVATPVWLTVSVPEDRLAVAMLAIPLGSALWPLLGLSHLAPPFVSVGGGPMFDIGMASAALLVAVDALHHAAPRPRVTLEIPPPPR